MRSGRCFKCSKRTQGKSESQFICRVCSTNLEKNDIKQNLLNLSEFDLGWLSGIIEGEGCFYKKTSKCKLKTGTYCYPLCGFALMSTDHDVMVLSIKKEKSFLF